VTEKEGGRESLAGGLPAAGFPGPHFPTVYADGVTSVSPGAQVVKIYLSRLDSNFVVTSGSTTQPFLQLIMPTSGYLQMAMFFNKVIEGLLANKFISQEQYDEAKKNAGISNP